MYIDTLAYQTREFFYSLGFGFILGILYDLTIILKLSVHDGKKKAFAFDIFYAAAAAILSVIFVLGSCRGKFAFYVILGMTVGFAIYQFTLGSILRKIISIICVFLRKIILRIVLSVIRFFRIIITKTVTLMKKVKTPKKKTEKNHEKHLQKE